MTVKKFGCVSASDAEHRPMGNPREPHVKGRQSSSADSESASPVALRLRSVSKK